MSSCKQSGHAYAGVQNSNQCFCGNTCPSDDLLVAETDCHQPCTGDSDQTCGGSWRINVYGLHYNKPGPGLRSLTEFNNSYSVVLSSGDISGQHCFSFWHFMYGSHVETLNVFVTVEGQQLLYFSKSGNQGLRWILNYFTPH